VPFWQLRRPWNVSLASCRLNKSGDWSLGTGRLFLQLLQSNEVVVGVPKQEYMRGYLMRKAGGIGVARGKWLSLGESEHGQRAAIDWKLGLEVGHEGICWGLGLPHLKWSMDCLFGGERFSKSSLYKSCSAVRMANWESTVWGPDDRDWLNPAPKFSTAHGHMHGKNCFQRW